MTDLERVRNQLVMLGYTALVRHVDTHLKEDAEWYKRWEGVAEKLRDQEAELTEAREHNAMLLKRVGRAEAELTELREAVRVYTDNPSSNDRLVQLDRLRQLIEEKS